MLGKIEGTGAPNAYFSVVFEERLLQYINIRSAKEGVLSMAATHLIIDVPDEGMYCIFLKALKTNLQVHTLL